MFAYWEKKQQMNSSAPSPSSSIYIDIGLALAMTDFKACMHECMNTSSFFHILESNSFPDIKWCIQYIVAMLFSHKFWLFSRRLTSFGDSLALCMCVCQPWRVQRYAKFNGWNMCVWMYACKLKIHYKYTPLLSRAHTIFLSFKRKCKRIVEISRFMLHARL